MTALVSFTIYLGVVFLIAVLANRSSKGKSFVGEFFLGSKGIGLWAFALTYAATSASGGSFMGFPSYIYEHGWVMAWWIAGYMVVPLIALGLLAKRLNQVGRIAGAITVPELLRRRFESGAVGNTATILVVFFLFFFLMAQFKAGAEIMATLLDGVPIYHAAVALLESAIDGVPYFGAARGEYLLCLMVFAVSVISYTTFGGFRAVVWTDVMQGIVMGLGVAIMLVLALWQTGGLSEATRQIDRMTPPRFVDVSVEATTLLERETRLPAGSWLADEHRQVYRLKEAVEIPAGESDSSVSEALRVTTPEEVRRILERKLPIAGFLAVPSSEEVGYAHGDGEPGVYVHAPGPHRSNPAGFLGAMLALSFFAFWNFSGAGQPSYMVRQMAFRDTRILRRSIVMVAVYFSAIYLPLVVIFTCARVLLPGMEIHPDRVMPEMASYLTESAGAPWLAGLLVAAPFAAVMSSVDSFLLLVSSGIVRDIYEESINPNADERTLKRLAHGTTIVVGLLGFVAVVHPPQFLQDLIVFASGGLGGCFLVPTVFALYWPRTTPAAMVAGMIAGGVTTLVLYSIGFFLTRKFVEYRLFDLHPFVWAVVVSTIVVYGVSRTGRPPGPAILSRYFGDGLSG